MPVQKIKSGRVLSPNVDNYIGNKGQIFYDEDTGELRLSNGITPGGISIGTGPKGAQGSTGPTGPQGITGPQGPQGARGPQGVSGPSGPQGIRGPTGPQGVAGPSGPQGVAGPSGPQGRGVPAGGSSGQSLVKVSSTDYDTTWATITGGGGGGGTAYVGNFDGGFPDSTYGGITSIDAGGPTG